LNDAQIAPERRARPLLGTVVSMRVEAGPRAARALDAAFAVVAAVQVSMSFHDANSELSRLNREAASAWVPVSPGLERVLRAALALASASAGRFDPTVAARLVEWGQLPRPAGAPDADTSADWRSVEMRAARVRFRRPTWIDLGGIAKGYAVDRAIAVLQAHGVGHGVVNAGGDLRVFGGAFETIYVRDPATPAHSRPLLRVRQGAAATSSGYFSAGGGYTALVDTYRATPLGDGVSATVCAPRALWADALTKIALAGGDAAPSLFRRLGAQAALLDAAGSVRILQ
jgi:thiamine biosynthesis lipoprotein